MISEDALLLLEAMVEKVRGRAGARVQPSEVAREYEIGLEPGTPRCNRAVEELESEGAIEEDVRTSGYTLLGLNYPYYRPTQHGIDLARSSRS